MNKHERIFALLVCSVVYSSLMTRGATAARPDIEVGFDVGISVCGGTAGFDEGETDTWESELEWPLDGYLGEIRFKSACVFPIGGIPVGLGARGMTALSLDAGGTSSDSDWDENSVLYAYSESDSDANISMWDADVFVFVRPAWGQAVSFEGGLFLGYGSQSFDFTDRDVRATYPEAVIVEGLSGTYDATFSGARVGGYAVCSPVKGFLVSIEATAIPSLEAEGDAYWAMRDYPFQQSAEGAGSALYVRASYRCSDNLSVFAGVRKVALTADRNGVESGILNGMEYSNEPIVWEISADYATVDAGLTISF